VVTVTSTVPLNGAVSGVELIRHAAPGGTPAVHAVVIWPGTGAFNSNPYDAAAPAVTVLLLKKTKTATGGRTCEVTVEVSLVVMISPPPATVAVFTTELGAFAATLTVNVIEG